MREVILEYGTENDLFHFSRVRQDGPINMKHNHFHGSYELYYLISGQRYYFIKDKTIRVMENDLILIKKGDLHKTASCGESQHERILINFKEEYLNSELEELNAVLAPFNDDVNVIRFNIQQQSVLEDLLNTIQDELTRKDSMYKLSAQALFAQLLIYLSRHVKRYGMDEHFKHPSLMHKKVSGVVQYINANYMKTLTLRDIAKLFDMNYTYLSKVFKRATGFTLIEYINSVRIKEAQNLLLTTEDQVIDISYKVGYVNTSHFNRVFKGMTGLSPLQFRKANRKSSLNL